MKLEEFANTMDDVSAAKGNGIKDVLKEQIRQQGPKTVEVLCRLTLGDLFDDPEKNTHVAAGTVYSVTADATGVSKDKLREVKQDRGKVSHAVEYAFRQIEMGEPVIEGNTTITDIHREISKLPNAKGDKHRARIVRGMFDLCWSARQAKWVSYSLLTDLSIGCGWKTFAGAFAQVEGLPKEDLYKSTSIVGGLSEAIAGYYENGSLVLTPEIGEPFGPMLAVPGKAASYYEGTDYVAQTKFDGARLLIHNTEDDVTLYSRNQKDQTESLPEVTEIFEHDTREYILDAEVVGYDPDTGEVQPFNKVMTRFNRETNIEEKMQEVQARIFVFDCIYDGEWIIEDPFVDRFDHIPQDITVHENAEIAPIRHDVEKAYEDALVAGHEGVIVKNPEAPFVFERSNDWQKIKPTETLDLKVSRSLAGSGDRAGKLGSVVVETGDGVELGNVGGGFTDPQLEKWKDGELNGKTIEVMAEELSETDSGYALRFPRFEGVRSDKDIADDLERVEDLLQFAGGE